MKAVIYLHLILLSNACCLGSEKSDNVKAVELKVPNVNPKSRFTVMETFNEFFTKFKSNRSIQYSRTLFPLKTILKSDDGEQVKIVNRRDWTFTNFARIRNLIVTKNNLSREKVDIIFTIEDTGLNTIYHFENKKGLWWLTRITDESD